MTSVMTPALSFALHFGYLPRWGIDDKNARTKKPEERFLNKRSSGLSISSYFAFCPMRFSVPLSRRWILVRCRHTHMTNSSTVNRHVTHCPQWAMHISTI